MNEKLRQYLDLIDTMLCDPMVGSQLADVLSAIRSADKDPTGEIKPRTTTFIRKAAFPMACANPCSPVAMYKWDLAQDTLTEIQGVCLAGDPANSHFEGHIALAAQALGLRCNTNVLP